MGDKTVPNSFNCWRS